MTREALDKIAWASIHARAPFPGGPGGLAATQRPANYQELWEQIDAGREWGGAWSEYLHEFYRYQSASFFAVPPPDNFSPGYRALLAGAAEYLCADFGLPVPEWVHDPAYVMPELWEPDGWMYPEDPEFRERRRLKADPAFLKRNVLYDSRGLIAL